MTSNKSRNEEITADFLKLVDSHMDDLLNDRVDHRYHATDFENTYLFIQSFDEYNNLTTGRSPCDFMEERLQEAAQTKLRETT